jgi:hypothetical protein
MRTQLADAPGRTRTIWGEVNADGTIRQGSGDFTVRLAGTGTYTIHFLRPFATAPALTMHPVDAQGFPYTPNGYVTPTDAGFVFSNTYAGAGVNLRFMFSITGRLGV